MARTAVVRSASLAPETARMADELAEHLTAGSFSQLTQLLLSVIGEPLRQRVKELEDSGLDPKAKLFVTNATPPDTAEQIRHFYAASTWPEDGPKAP